MSKKQWFALLIFFLTYLLIGAAIFYMIESKEEMERNQEAMEERKKINALLHAHYKPDVSVNHDEILRRLTTYCGKSVFNDTDVDKDDLKWNFYNSFYFAYTVVSTIGYGNLAPTTPHSRILMIFYALVGIPINGILLAQLGEFFGQVFVKAVDRYKLYKKSQNEYSKKLSSLEKRRAGLAIQIFMYLLPGFLTFIFIPAFLFSYFEGWTYDVAVYYAFVTLTTIGFGDYVANDNIRGSTLDVIFYKIFVIGWISFGLGYIVMIMTFIARGMKCKKVARIEHKLVMNLKHTQNKIWNEFNKEVNYLRRVFNELQLSKVKRVYVDDYDYQFPPHRLLRRNSFPNLRQLMYGGKEPPQIARKRRRANSEVVHADRRVARVVSESDLQRIDKRATFATHAMIQPAELLARLVNILGYIPPPEDDEPPEADKSVQGFSDKEILASETDWWKTNTEPGWIIGGSRLQSRSRAASEVRLDNPAFLRENSSEWTWSGPASTSTIKEIMKARKSCPPDTKEQVGKSLHRILSLGLPSRSKPKSLIPRWMRQLNTSSVKKSTQDLAASIEHVESGLKDIDNYSKMPSAVDDVSDRRTYFTHTGAAGTSNLLEETSVADFLRAMTAFHSHMDSTSDELANTVKPSRKFGTASLTPPKLPSLFTLFSPQSGETSDDLSSQTQSVQNTVGPQYPPSRRYSLRTLDYSGTSTPVYQRRLTNLQNQQNRVRRRFSLRPVNMATIPQYVPAPEQVQEYPTLSTAPPAYTSDPFFEECPKQPLVNMESQPGISSPIMPATSFTRSSLRTSPLNTGTNQQINKAMIPRWRAALLQKQLGQGTSHHRVRAFSLSDVNIEKFDRNNATVSPLASEDHFKTFGSREPSGTKTVTIVSPDLPKKRDRYKEDDLFLGSRNVKKYSGDLETISSSNSSSTLDALDLQSRKHSLSSMKSGDSSTIDEESGGKPRFFIKPKCATRSVSLSEQSSAENTENQNDNLVPVFKMCKVQDLDTIESDLNAASNNVNQLTRRSLSTAEPSASRQPSIAPITSWADTEHSKSLENSSSQNEINASKSDNPLEQIQTNSNNETISEVKINIEDFEH